MPEGVSPGQSGRNGRGRPWRASDPSSSDESIRTGFAGSVQAVANSADLDEALQALAAEYGGSVGASTAMLATGGWQGTAVGQSWLYETTPDGPDSAALESLVAELRAGAGSALDPGTDFMWKSRREGGSTCDYVGLRVRIAGLPGAALCAALEAPADPPDPLVELTRRFASIASICLLSAASDHDGGGHAGAVTASCLEQGEIRGALASELSRCGLSREPVSLCFVSFPDSAASGSAIGRLMAIMGQVVAEAGQPYDFVGRLSDSELLVIMPGADHNSGVATARHLMRVARLSLDATIGDHVPPLFRIAEWDRSENADELLGRASTEVRRAGPGQAAP